MEDVLTITVELDAILISVEVIHANGTVLGTVTIFLPDLIKLLLEDGESMLIAIAQLLSDLHAFGTSQV